ncbi:MAG: EEP domain-containing protein [Betaproteobacteria bacterium]|nr:EEP domain-containing protein [Betaproteobacteria bacterium]
MLDLNALAKPLRVATCNIHKGLSMFNRRVVIHSLREQLQALDADIVFLQEVAARHDTHVRRHGQHWPREPQHEFLSDLSGLDHAYGRNALYDGREHGNAVLSRYPIVSWENQDVSTHRFEKRGLLHCEIEIPGWDQTLHCVCVHLALHARGRSRQLEHLRQRIERMVPHDAPLIVAGDFNDWHWRHKATHEFAHPLNMHEVFETDHGRPARSFPALLPLLRLDRIYVRGLKVRNAHVTRARGWHLSSDHRALTCELNVL